MYFLILPELATENFGQFGKITFFHSRRTRVAEAFGGSPWKTMAWDDIAYLIASYHGQGGGCG
jgi:hypothetical protein